MSQFLRNIIARHLTKVSCPVVAPRRRSRFETDTGNISSPRPQTAPSDRNQVPDQAGAPLPCGSSGKTGSMNTRPQQRSIHWADAAVNDTRSDSSEKWNPVLRTADKTTQVMKGITADTPITESSNGDQLFVSHESEHRTRSILSRLKITRPHNSTHQPGDTNSIDLPGIGPQVNLPHSVDVHSANSESGSLGPVSTEPASRTAEPVDTGLLQAPAWVDELQSGLQSRYPGMAAQKTVEPTVNVTIGRIEIRAAREKVSKTNEPRNQTAGIMSLDDYLEKQNGRRQ